MTKKEAKSFINFGFREKSLHNTLIFEKYEDISYVFMCRIDAMVSFAKEQFGKDKGAFLVYDINLLKHKDHSYHYAIDGHLSIAIDGAFRGLSPIEAYFVITKFRFNGIGYYPDWKPCPGWHIDMRPTKYAALWVAHKYDFEQLYYYNFRNFIREITDD